QQPVLAFFARLALHSNQMPPARELLAFKLEFKMALGVALMRVMDRGPGAAIPQDHRAAAIFALGNGTLEAAIFEGMVLDMNGQPLLFRHEAWPPRHGPALEH